MQEHPTCSVLASSARLIFLFRRAELTGLNFCSRRTQLISASCAVLNPRLCVLYSGMRLVELKLYDSYGLPLSQIRLRIPEPEELKYRIYTETYPGKFEVRSTNDAIHNANYLETVEVTREDIESARRLVEKLLQVEELEKYKELLDHELWLYGKSANEMTVRINDRITLVFRNVNTWVDHALRMRVIEAELAEVRVVLKEEWWYCPACLRHHYTRAVTVFEAAPKR